jgi:hypothetical protein
MPSSSGSVSPTGESEEAVITSMKFFSTQSAKVADDNVGIRATDVALGLRRVPSGFYIVVHHSGLQWRTENKPSSVNDDVVEWSGPIPL